LARPPEEISALAVVETMEGSLSPVGCIEDPGSCDHQGQCSTEALWRRVDMAIREVLGGTNLKDLIDERLLIEAKKRMQTAG